MSKRRSAEWFFSVRIPWDTTSCPRHSRSKKSLLDKQERGKRVGSHPFCHREGGREDDQTGSNHPTIEIRGRQSSSERARHRGHGGLRCARPWKPQGAYGGLPRPEVHCRACSKN